MNKLKIIILCIAICLITSCTSKTNKLQNEILLGEKTGWLSCEENIKIADTKDSLKIDSSLENLKFGDGNVTANFSQKIKYTITVEGVAYEGAVVFNSDTEKPAKEQDGNPKYEVELVNFREKAVQVIVKTKKTFD